MGAYMAAPTRHPRTDGSGLGRASRVKTAAGEPAGLAASRGERWHLGSRAWSAELVGSQLPDVARDER